MLTLFDLKIHCIVNFRSRLLKLPDKGERIQKLYKNIVNEINARNEIDLAAKLFSDLNIVEKGIKTVTHMEWSNGKVNSDQLIVAADTLDSDDDVDGNSDPLKIIAQSRQTKVVKVVKPPPSLITEADLQDIKSIEAENQTKNMENGQSVDETSTKSETDEIVANKTVDTSIELEPHANYVMKKDRAFDGKSEMPKKFLPFRTTISDVHDVEKEKQRKHGKHWEVTAATPPTMRNNAVKMIPLQESIETERQHKEKLHEQMEKQAEERLAMRKKIVSENISLLPSGSALMDPNSFFQSYRQRDENADESDGENEPFSDNSDDGEEPDTHGISIVIDE